MLSYYLYQCKYFVVNWWMFNFFSLFILVESFQIEQFLVLAHNIAYTKFKTLRFIYRRKNISGKKMNKIHEEKNGVCVCRFFSFSRALEYKILYWMQSEIKQRLVKCVQQEPRTDRDGDEDTMKNCVYRVHRSI